MVGLRTTPHRHAHQAARLLSILISGRHTLHDNVLCRWLGPARVPHLLLSQRMLSHALPPLDVLAPREGGCTLHPLPLCFLATPVLLLQLYPHYEAELIKPQFACRWPATHSTSKQQQHPIMSAP
jgi:hypothetical protein